MFLSVRDGIPTNGLKIIFKIIFVNSALGVSFIIRSILNIFFLRERLILSLFNAKYVIESLKRYRY